MDREATAHHKNAKQREIHLALPNGVDNENPDNSYLRFRPNAFHRRAEPLPRSVFCRPD